MSWPVAYARTVKLGVKSLLLHKLRSILTTLGILFGVSSVIAMLSIGEGASYEAQQQIAQLGARNIIIRAVKPPEEQSAGAMRSRILEYGLTYDDAERLVETMPGVKIVVPVREVRKDLFRGRRRTSGVVRGTVPWYPKVANHRLGQGRFISDIDVYRQANVCVLGDALARELYPLEYPLGTVIKAGDIPFTVVGVMEPRAIVGNDADRDTGFEMLVPLSTAQSWFGEVTMKRSTGSMEMERVQLHQINAEAASIEDVLPTADVIREMLERFHKKRDYELIVPLELLRRAEETKRIFNIVLGSIAGISLLVGGIGIMNVMLASVTERTREIGIRRALGAKKRHIVAQFLVETVVLSGSGGLLGVAVGTGIPFLVTYFAKMRTIITPASLVMALGISAMIGIVFGLYPAIRAANMDPVEALRHE
ncbi:MAG: ABC transporter permease [Planctomycetota bacterium]